MPRSIETDWLVVGGGSAGCVLAGRLSEDPAEQVRAARGRAGLAFERGARAAAQHERLAGARRDGVRAVPVAGARVPADERTGAEAAPARQGPRRLVGGQRHDRHPRDGRRLRPLGGRRLSRLVVRRGAALSAPDGERRELRRSAVPRRRRADPGPAAAPRRVGPGSTTRSPRARLGLGYGWCEDHNAPTGTGVSPYAISARDGARVTTNDAYLEPARDRANLRVFGRATVDKVLVEAGRATGVRARDRRRGDRRPSAGRRPVRRRGPLPGDPAAVGHRARRIRRAAAGRRGDAGAPARAVLALPSRRVPARHRRPADELLPALLVRSRGSGRERHDDRVGQPDARAARTMSPRALAVRRRDRDLGRRRRRAGRRRARACCACGPTRSSPRPADASPRPIPMSSR